MSDTIHTHLPPLFSTSSFLYIAAFFFFLHFYLKQLLEKKILHSYHSRRTAAHAVEKSNCKNKVNRNKTVYLLGVWQDTVTCQGGRRPMPD